MVDRCLFADFATVSIFSMFNFVKSIGVFNFAPNRCVDIVLNIHVLVSVSYYYAVIHTRTKFAGRSLFSVHRPSVWNALPTELPEHYRPMQG